METHPFDIAAFNCTKAFKVSKNSISNVIA